MTISQVAGRLVRPNRRYELS